MALSTATKTTGGIIAAVLAFFMGRGTAPAPPPVTTPPPVLAGATVEKTSPFDIGVALTTRAIKPGFRLASGALAYHTDVKLPNGKTLDINTNCATTALISRGKTGGQDHVGCDSGNVSNDHDFGSGFWKYVQDANGARMVELSGGSGPSSPSEASFVPPGAPSNPTEGQVYTTAGGTSYRWTAASGWLVCVGGCK